jgi:hypothetical protein
MADYEFQYKLQSAPEPRSDGTAMVALDMFAVCRVKSTTEPFVEVPGKHKSVLIPASGVQTALVTGTNNQKVVKVKDLIRQYIFASAPDSPTGWEPADLETYMDANDLAIAQAAALNTFITVTLNKPYPVTFPL